jgi:hypothetical protein
LWRQNVCDGIKKCNYNTRTAYPSRTPRFTPVFGGVRVARLLSFLCFVCLHPVSYVHNVAGVSGLSIHVCSFDFL